LPAKLERVIDSDMSVAEFPAIDAEDRWQLAVAIDEHQAAMSGTSMKRFESLFGGLALCYPAGKLSEEEADKQVDVYASLLCDLPEDILSAAFRKVAQTSKFFPTPAEIRAEAVKPLALRSWKLMRMRVLAKQYDTSPAARPVDDEPITAGQIAELKASLAGAGETLRAPKRDEQRREPTPEEAAEIARILAGAWKAKAAAAPSSQVDYRNGLSEEEYQRWFKAEFGERDEDIDLEDIGISVDMQVAAE
jgi:hypothetical protein